MGAVTLSIVEGLSAEACPPCFDGAQHDTLLNKVQRRAYCPEEGIFDLRFLYKTL
ncbi:hypothetical protein SAMN05428975_0567 [Mucilaginibacter sp. OK268]|nr:hypothetical protein SAMN05428975_0567 [Mucilaginibacter sp. OK268]